MAVSDRDKELLKKRKKEERKKAKALAKSNKNFGGNRKSAGKLDEKRRLDVNKHKLEINITKDDLEELGASNLKQLEKAQKKMGGTATNISSKMYKAKLKEAQQVRKKKIKSIKRRALATSVVLGLLVIITAFIAFNKEAVFGDGNSGGGGGGTETDFGGVTQLVIDIIPVILIIQVLKVMMNAFSDISETENEGDENGNSITGSTTDGVTLGGMLSDMGGGDFGG